MIRTVIMAAGFIGLPLITSALPLITSAPAQADAGPVSTIACSDPCNIVENTIANYSAFIPDTIQNYTGACTAGEGGDDAGNELSCTPVNYAAFPGDTLRNYAAFPEDTLRNYAMFPGDTLRNYAAFPGETISNYASFVSDTIEGYLGAPAGDDAAETG